MDDVERRRELGNFVRTRRERITPKEAGVSVSGCRRTPGLRREEVAYLASVSVTWYTWLEQGRDITVSSQVLNTVARALRMNPTERAHLFMLARQPLVPALPPADKMPPALQRVLDSLNPNPAYLTGRRWNLLGWNAAALEVFGGFGPDAVHGRNLLWLCFTNPEWRRRIVDWEAHAQCILALFRLSYGLYTGDNACSQLVRDLQQTSAEFARWWSRHEVNDQPGGRKEFWHPTVGRLILEDSILKIVTDKPDLRLFLYTPLDEEDTPAKLRKLVSPLPKNSLLCEESKSTGRKGVGGSPVTVLVERTGNGPASVAADQRPSRRPLRSQKTVLESGAENGPHR